MPTHYEATDDIRIGPFVLVESDISLLQSQGIISVQPAPSPVNPGETYPRMQIDLQKLYDLAIGKSHWLELPPIDVDALPAPGAQITSLIAR